MRAAKKVYSNVNNPAFQDNIYKMSSKAATRHFRSFMAEEDIPRVQSRLNQIRAIQSIEEVLPNGDIVRPFENFQPTNGHVVGTPEALALQRVIDTKNPDLAREKFVKTSEAARKLAERYRTTTSLDEKALIADVISDWHNQIANHLRSVQDSILEVEARAANLGRSPGTSTQMGEDTRLQLQRLREHYKVIRDEYFDQIDPEGLTKFDAKSLINTIEELTYTTDPLRALSKSDPGYTFLTEKLPAYISKVMKGGQDLPSNSLMNSPELPTIDFKELSYIYQQLGSQASKIARTDPTSNAPNLMQDIREVIKEVMDTKMVTGDPDIARRYEKARSFMSNEYYPRFREGVGGELLEIQRGSNAFTLRSDEILDTIWQKGDKETKLEEFLSIFSKEIGDSVPPEQVSDIIDIARSNLNQHAIRTLQNALDGRGTKSPLDVFQQWKRDYRGAINSFPDIADDVASLERRYAAMEFDKATQLDVIRDLHETTLSRYLKSFKPGKEIDPSDVDVDKLIQGIFNGTAKDADDILRDIYSAAASADGRRTALTLQYELGGTLREVDRSGGELQRVDRAIKDLMFDQLFVRNMENVDDVWLPNGDKIFQLFYNQKDKFAKIFSDKEIQDIEKIIDVFRVVGKQSRPTRSIEIDKAKEILTSLGISPASVLSRYYSAALGKVGPLYLFTDFMTRLATGMSSRYFDRVYRELMYDLDGLQKILDIAGNEVASATAKTLKEYVQEAGVPGLQDSIRKGIFSQEIAKILYMGQSLEFIEEGTTELDKMIDQYQEGSQSIGDWYLKMNDNLTGQPSRLAGSMLPDDESDSIESRLAAMGGAEEGFAADTLESLSDNADRNFVNSFNNDIALPDMIEKSLLDIEDGKTYVFDPVTGQLVEEVEGDD